MTQTDKPVRRRLLRELAGFAALLLFGLVLLPVAVYGVGQFVFGAYEGDGFGGFYEGIVGRLAGGEPAAWFLALSPFLGIVLLRLIVWAWRRTARLAA